MPSNAFFAALQNAQVRMPDSAINYGGPLPSIPSGSPQFTSADGQYNQHSMPISGLSPYAYGTAARISTQTQMAHPNRVALIIPKLYLPSPQADIATVNNPVLEHAISDGDLVFSFRMTSDMTSYGSQYFVAPYGYSSKAVPLINLSTANYILWGLQVGLRLARNSHWMLFFAKLLRNHPIIQNIQNITVDQVWNFVRTYLRPFGIQHGGDQQGGQHEGDADPIVTHGAVDYVSSYAIEGKLLHVNNLWRDHDIHEGDDLILSLTQMNAPHADLFFDLSSSTRSHRTEKVPVTNSWYYLRPNVLAFKSFSDSNYIHIGRSQKYCSLFSRGADVCCWNARMCVIPGAPLQLTFEPSFMQSDDMFYEENELIEHTTAIAAEPYGKNSENLTNNPMETVALPPLPYHLPRSSVEQRNNPHKRPLPGVVGAQLEAPLLLAAADNDMPPPAARLPTTSTTTKKTKRSPAAVVTFAPETTGGPS